MSRRRLWLVPLALFLVALTLRVAHARGQGLWGDELFSLAMATGHSLEGPPETFDPELGDFTAFEEAQPAAVYRGYLSHHSSLTSPARVLRAVFLSDTSPPLYYLALWAWTLIVGTGDGVVRLFSVLGAAACVPVLWSVARQLGGRRAAFAACFLFAVLPLAIDFAIEVRMYAMLWFWSVATAWAALRLHRRGATPAGLAIWGALTLAGFLTHYFYAFVWAGMAGWLFLQPGRAHRGRVALATLAAGLLLLPWFLRVPESLAAWRTTKDWLKNPAMVGLDRYNPFELTGRTALGFFLERSASTDTQGRYRVAQWVLMAAATALLVGMGRRAVSGRRRLAWMWLAGACLGPLLFDLLQKTYTAAVPRYAIAGMPAAFLLAGVALGRLPRWGRAAALAAITLASLPALHRLFTDGVRDAWYKPVGKALAQRAGPDDLVLVHSIPSGALGVVRYGYTPASLALWTQQLRRHRTATDPARVEADTRRLTEGYRRVFVVTVHNVGEPAPEEDYLRAQARVVSDSWPGPGWAHLVEFAPASGEAFAWPTGGGGVEEPPATEPAATAPSAVGEAPPAGESRG